jgi:hypothetical protein
MENFQKSRLMSDYEIFLASALNIVGALFAVYELTEKAAFELGIKSETHYPTAEHRYKSFRRTCIDDLDVPEEAFTEFCSLQVAPNVGYEWFRHTTEEISWRAEAM